MADPDDDELAAFWAEAKRRGKLSRMPGYFPAGSLEALQPPAWSFGATPEHADELLGLVLEGTKTATASALWDYEHAGEPLPEAGELSILLDGQAHPRALITTTAVRVVPFDEVDAGHAHAEGEGDRTLAYWREVHEDYFRRYAEHDRGFQPDMPVVLEEFKVLYRAGQEA